MPTGASVTPNLERGTIAFSSNEPGEYIFLYNVGADAAVSVGLVRVQVVEPPAEAPPPIAVKDTAYLRPGEPTSVPVLANDVSPSGRVLAVQSVDDTETDDLVSVEILHEHRRPRSPRPRRSTGSCSSATPSPTA